MYDKDILLKEIRDKGVDIEKLDDLIRIDKRYRDLVPIIQKHLVQATDEGYKEHLVRCLGVRGFTEATPALVKEFLGSTNNTYKWAIGNTLYCILDKSSLDTLMMIAQDKKHGRARQMIVLAIGKMKDNKAVPLLIDLLSDEDVTAHAVAALGNMKDMSVIPYIEPLTKHRSKFIRTEAEKVIRKLSKQAR